MEDGSWGAIASLKCIFLFNNFIDTLNSNENIILWLFPIQNFQILYSQLYVEILGSVKDIP